MISSGFHDREDNHHLGLLGSAIMMRLIAGAMSYAAD
jgi:type IV secretory pathway VirB10-like protein